MNTEKQINKYISLLYKSADRIALCLIRNGDPVQHRFTGVRNIGRFIPFLRAMNVQNWNIYITPSIMKVGVVKRTKANFIPEQDVIYIDADDKQVMEKVRADYPYPVLVVRTSAGHYQIYWKLTEKISVELQENLMKQIAQSVGGDNATDVSRVLRLPGFWNKKPGKDNTVDIVFTRDERVPYKRLLEVANVYAPQSVTTNTIPPSAGLRECALRNFSKSEQDWYLVNLWLREGKGREECIECLKKRRAGEKKDIDYYSRYTVDKALTLSNSL